MLGSLFCVLRVTGTADFTGDLLHKLQLKIRYFYVLIAQNL